MPTVGSGSLFRILDFQARGSETFLNRYWYFVPNAPNTFPVATVFAAWETVMSDTITNCQTSGLTHTTTEVEEVTSLTNFGVFNSTQGSGALLGTPLPNFCAASFRLLRSSKETRGGFKRIIAGDEAVAAGNVWETTFLNTQLAALGGQLASSLNPIQSNFIPCIVRETRDQFGDLNPPALWLYNPVAGVEVTNLITTQNSRKIGVGI